MQRQQIPGVSLVVVRNGKIEVLKSYGFSNLEHHVLPVIEFLGTEHDRYEAIMTISLAVVDKCDAILMIGKSPGANRERDLIRAKGLPVYNSVSQFHRERGRVARTEFKVRVF